MGVVEAARLSIGNATSSSFGLVGGAEIGISAGYGWFVDFKLTEE